VTDADSRRPRPLDRDALYQFALKSLGARAQSTGELRQRLRLRAANAEDVDEILAQLKENGYLDDRRFAESFAASRLNNDRLGKTRVIHDLRQRRVAPPLAEGAVKQVYEGVDESALIENWIRRKYRKLEEDKDLARAYRGLARAGFRTGEIVRALKKFAKNPELLDNLE
jgi:regulatory protein